MIEEIIGYFFADKKLLEEALSHPSCDVDFSYERMEFLGDSVLGLVISTMLYEKHPEENEGHLAKRRAALVCGETLAKVAEEIGLGEYIAMGVGEDSGGGRENAANLENAFEAVIGAIYLDGGIEPATAFIRKYFEQRAEDMLEAPKDAKTSLQEWAQAQSFSVPAYDVVERSGPAHDPIFTVEVSVQGQEPVRASGTSKKVAEMEAAKLMLEKISA